MELLILAFGWSVSGFLAYGLGKNLLWKRDFKQLYWDSFNECVCWLTALCGPIMLPILAVAIPRLEGQKMLGLTYRIPKQKTLPAPGETGLVRQTGKEKVMARIEKAEERRKKEEEEMKRRVTLAREKEAQERLKNESARYEGAYAELVPRLSKELLRMRPEDMEDFGEEEYQCLDLMIRKKIGLGHRIADSCNRLWGCVASLAEWVDCADKSGMGFGHLALLFMVSAPMIMGSELLGPMGFVGAGFLQIASLIAGYHASGGESGRCEKCRYLHVSRYLRKHNIPKALAVEKLNDSTAPTMKRLT